MTNIATYSIDKTATKFNKKTQDWSGDVNSVFVEEGFIRAQTQEEALKMLIEQFALDDIEFIDGEKELGEKGRFFGNRAENSQGDSDKNGKFLSDYNICIKMYKPMEQ